MKNIKNKISTAIVVIAMGGVMTACNKDFLERNPIGSISETTLANRSGIEGLLVGAYSLLDGVGHNIGNTQDVGIHNTYVSNSASDEAHKGGTYGNQSNREELEGYYYTSNNSLLLDKWRMNYAGVHRANEVIRLLEKLPEGELTEAESLQIRAEARFIRGVFHLEAAKMWRNVPYLDETVSFETGNYLVKNNVPIWSLIEADFDFAAQNLAHTHSQVGRVNSWAAKAFLAKTYMFQQKFTDAKPLLEDVINNGATTKGEKYGLQEQYAWNFQIAHKNSKESVFAVQMSVKDGANGMNGNAGDAWSLPMHLDGWGNLPSFTLVNTFKTDAAGLPLVNTFNDANVKSDMGLPFDDPFTAHAGPLDPRLDWTVGRRNIPYHDWGLHQRSWIASQEQGGPYSPKKGSHWQAEHEAFTDRLDGWMTANPINYNMIRFADVLLWAAEVEVEIGSLDVAQQYVNRVRARAANPSGFLHAYLDNSDPSLGFSNTPAANYVINEYPVGHFSTLGKENAREAVRFERRLELGMEGHRFFDLQRYDAITPGYMGDILNAYSQHENQSFKDYLDGIGYRILENAVFIKGRHEIYAIPLLEIDLSTTADGPTLMQNPGHN